MKKRKKYYTKKKTIISLIIIFLISSFLISSVYFPEYSKNLKNIFIKTNSLVLPSLYSRPIPNPGHGGDEVYIKINGEKTLQQAINDNDFQDQCGYTGGNLQEEIIHGHSGNEIIVNLNNQQKTLQQAIDDSSLSSLSNTRNSPASYNQINYGQPANEILIDINGEKTLQQAINQGDFENDMVSSQYSSGYSIYKMQTMDVDAAWSSRWETRIDNSQLVSTDSEITYYTSEGNWLPENTHTESLRLNVAGTKKRNAAKSPLAGVLVYYRIYDNETNRVKTKTWGDHGELKLDRIDTFKRETPTSILVNGNPITLSLGETHTIQSKTWNPGDHGNGRTDLKITNDICGNYLQIRVYVREYDEEHDSAWTKLESYIEPA